MRGGAFGYGLSENVRNAYRFLVENYEPGDHVYLFGFSRGAYTARSTVGLIRNCGILRREHRDRVQDAYALYRLRGDPAHPNGIESRIFRRMYSHDDVTMHFVGVWDTVGSLGIPIDGLMLPMITKLWGFHDTELSSHVASAYQALAIDEERGPFKPTLWKQQPNAGDQILRQVWFAGVHCDVGGGYEDPSLSEIPLLWMAQCASERGLRLDPDHFLRGGATPPDERRWMGRRLAPDALGEIHESRTGFYRCLPRHRRAPADGDGQSVSSSAVRRLEQDVGYHPAGLEGCVGPGATPVPDGP